MSTDLPPSISGSAAETKIVLLDESNILLEPRWTYTREGNLEYVQDPEQKLRMYFLSGDGLTHGRLALRHAWKAVHADFSLETLRETQPPARDGWEYVCQVVYQTPAVEARTVIGVQRIYRARSYINLVEGPDAVWGRRSAQIQAIIDSWQPTGFEKKKLNGVSAHAFSDSVREEFLSFVATAMSELQVPGASIAVVHNAKLVLSEASGVKALGGTEKIKRETRFRIASVTKPLTTLLMARLVDKALLSWDEPVSGKLSGFELGDPELTEKLQIKHTGCAGTGMPRRDLEFVFHGSRRSAQQYLDSMKTMVPTTGFGETFQYSNLLVGAGGFAAARAYCSDGSLEFAYAKSMSDLVFKPLHMQHSSVAGADPLPLDRAEPHAIDLNGTMVPIGFQDEDAVISLAPSGAAWSTADDLARYILFELRCGLIEDGSRLIGREALLSRREPGVKVNNNTYYGLGLFVENHSGIQVFHHGGNINGFTAGMWFLPESNSGLIVLTNAGSANAFREAVKAKLFELLFGDDLQAQRIVEFAKEQQKVSLAEFRSKLAIGNQSTGWMGNWAGTYHNPDLGRIEIKFVDGRYVIKNAIWMSEVAGSEENTSDRFIRFIDPWALGMGFFTHEEDGVRRLLLDSGQVQYWFDALNS